MPILIRDEIFFDKTARYWLCNSQKVPARQGRSHVLEADRFYIRKFTELPIRKSAERKLAEFSVAEI